MSGTLSKWRTRTPRDVLLFTGAWTILVSARVVWKVFPFRRVWQMAGGSDSALSTLTPPAVTLRPPASLPPEIRRIRLALDRASARVSAPTCLTRGLAAALLLRFSGLPYRLVIGVRKPADGDFAAHAWVLSGAEIAAGELPDLASYTPLPPGSAFPGLR